ncbi:VWA domain-containing protein [Hypericibacter terrae]|uniref:VWA domain-containing protein n=1 Tax=Hypericibacter terrae TaxID=2602015 RepID=A0A5J6MQ84_9PROT|nr:VWA domain-containing protein [Hypericibacter terrae]QEX16996.1 VWA domain-containing protein [Hypericibacter terrae]
MIPSLAATSNGNGAEPPPVEASRLAENVMFFARTLRAAGLPIGPGRVIDALRAIEAVGIGTREDLYWTLHAVFVNRRDQQPLYDQAFHIFWRNPQLLEKMLQTMLPSIAVPRDEPEKGEEMLRRLAEALAGRQIERPGEEPEEKVEFDAAMTFSARELLQGMDFEKMSNAEMDEARRMIAAMRLPIMQLPTRRFFPDRHGRRVDIRATLRASLRGGGTILLQYKRKRRRHPPLVVLCDISGSMSRYSRMMLHFMHAITNDRDRVHCFLFGTRLNNITRALRQRDVDVALAKVAAKVEDWSGGTRIGGCIAEFNAVWSRRVLGQGAVVLLITDGLDREGAHGLADEMERLHKSCRRLIWLNPLLRFEGYEPKAQGAQAILPHVDDFRPVHNLESIAELGAVLSRQPQRRLEAAGSYAELMAGRGGD